MKICIAIAAAFTFALPQAGVQVNVVPVPQETWAAVNKPQAHWLCEVFRLQCPRK